MLSNIVGTVLAFVTIMLMLSLIITSLVQFTQATLRLRGRNLLVGIGALIEKHAPNEDVKDVKRSGLRWNPHAAIAAHVLNEADASAKYLKDPNSGGRVIMGPPASWVNPEDLARALVKTANKHAAGTPNVPTSTAKAAATSLANAALAGNNAQPPAVALSSPGIAVQNTPPASTVDSQTAIAEAFKNMEPAISKRLQFIIRLWTVFYAFLIAFIFQLSTPDLLKQLPSADAKRQAILAAVPNLTNEATKVLALSNYNLLDEAVKRLTVKYPEYSTLFEEVSGAEEGASRQDMLDEMRGVLGKRTNRAQVLSDYAGIIDSLSQNSASAALTNSTALINQLDSFGISPKLDNFEFYTTRNAGPNAINGEVTWIRAVHWSNIIGVLITGILLSLGAPFWFEQLKTLSSLRDAMNPSSSAKSA